MSECAAANLDHVAGIDWRPCTDNHRDVTHEEARRYYAHFGQREWARLGNPADGVLEFAVNRKMIARYLATGARVLDIGGGPGRYSLWLADMGTGLSSPICPPSCSP